MTADQRSEREVLERARRGLGPSAGDAARIRRRVVAALAGGVSEAGSPDASSGDLAATTDAVETTTWAVKLAVLGSIAVAAGAGYVMGHHTGVSEGRAQTSTAQVVAAATSSATVPVDTPAPARVAPAPEAPLAPRDPGSASTPRAAPSASSAASRAAFDEEIIQLRRVQRALREGNARLALALLDDLDRAVPNGRLGEERAAASVMGRCALGVGPAAVLGADFTAKYPSSVYSGRVMQACGEGRDQ